MFHIDFETYSPIDLKKVGAYKYGECCEILMAAIAKDDDEPLLWINPKHRDTLPSQDGADDLVAEMLASTEPTYAHNASFEHAVSIHSPHFSGIDVKRWRCTSRMAAFAGIQASLVKAGSDLRLQDQKDPEGSKLIAKFSIPQPDGSRVFPWQSPMAFARFGLYCIQDVKTEQALHQKLKAFELDRYTHLLESYHNTLVMNARGYPVDVGMVDHGVAQLHKRYSEVEEHFYKATCLAPKVIDDAVSGAETPREMLMILKHLLGLTSMKAVQAILDTTPEGTTTSAWLAQHSGLKPTQGKKFKAWLEAKGFPLDDLQFTTVQPTIEAIKPIDPETSETLRQFGLLSYAAPKKFETMQASVSKDGRIRGHFVPGGAARTWRWSGSSSQPQNFRKVLKKDRKKEVHKMLVDRSEMTVEDLADGVRTVVRAEDGLIRGDYAQIECRVLLWLTGQDDQLDKFRRGEDLYVDMASKIFKKPTHQIDDGERTLGKVAVLGCGYGIGRFGFLAACESWGVEGVSEELAQQAVDAYRDAHPKVVNFWYACEDAFRKALDTPKVAFYVGADRRVYYRCDTLTLGDGHKVKVVRCFLPSGRPITYFDAREAEMDYDRNKKILRHWGQPIAGPWTHIKTYSSKLCENISQAVAADIMMNGFNQACEAGLEISVLVHDEAIADVVPTEEDQGVKLLEEMLTRLPDWAEGCPIVLDGEPSPSYSGV